MVRHLTLDQGIAGSNPATSAINVGDLVLEQGIEPYYWGPLMRVVSIDSSNKQAEVECWIPTKNEKILLKRKFSFWQLRLASSSCLERKCHYILCRTDGSFLCMKYNEPLGFEDAMNDSCIKDYEL